MDDGDQLDGTIQSRRRLAFAAFLILFALFALAGILSGHMTRTLTTGVPVAAVIALMIRALPPRSRSRPKE